MTDPFGLNESRSDVPAIPENRWIGRLKNIEIERGVITQGPRQGSPYLSYTVWGTDRKRFFTFSRTFGETACIAIKRPADVQIDHKPGFPCPTITAIQIIEPEEKQNGDEG